MGLGDLVLGIQLKSSGFEEGMNRCGLLMKEMAEKRVLELSKALEAASKAGGAIPKGLQTNLGQAIKQMDQADKLMERAGKKMHEGLEKGFKDGGGGKISAGILAWGTALGNMLSQAIGFATNRAVAAFDGQAAKAQARLRFDKSIEGTGGNASILGGPMRDEISRYSKAFGFSGTDAMGGVQSLMDKGLSPQIALQNLARMGDLAAYKGWSMTEAGDMIGKVYGGKTEGLNKAAGFSFTPTGNPLLDARAGLATIDAQTVGMAGRLKATESPKDAAMKAVDEFFEKTITRLSGLLSGPLLSVIGAVEHVLSNPALNKFLDAASKQASATVKNPGGFFQNSVNLVGDLGWEGMRAMGRGMGSGIMNIIPAGIDYAGAAVAGTAQTVLGKGISRAIGLDKAESWFTENAGRFVDRNNADWESLTTDYTKGVLDAQRRASLGRTQLGQATGSPVSDYPSEFDLLGKIEAAKKSMAQAALQAESRAPRDYTPGRGAYELDWQQTAADRQRADNTADQYNAGGRGVRVRNTGPTTINLVPQDRLSLAGVTY